MNFFRKVKWRILVLSCEGVREAAESNLCNDISDKINVERCRNIPQINNWISVYQNKFRHQSASKFGENLKEIDYCRNISHQKNSFLLIKAYALTCVDYNHDKCSPQNPVISSIAVSTSSHQTFSSKKTDRTSFFSNTRIQPLYDYEIPRQQQEKLTIPEIMQFKPTQSLLNPNGGNIIHPKTIEPSTSGNINPVDFFTQSLNKIKPSKSAHKSPSLPKRPLTTPIFAAEKKPKVDLRPHANRISNLIPSSSQMNPHHLENIQLKTIIDEQSNEIKYLKMKLKESNVKANKYDKNLSSNYSSVGERRQQKIVQEEYENFKLKYGDAAAQVITKMYQRFGSNETSFFNASLTSHIFQACAINLNKSRSLRREIYAHNGPQIFASERKVSDEKKRIRAGVEFNEVFIPLKVKAGSTPETKFVVTMKNVDFYIQRRLQQIMDNGLFRNIDFNGREEIWLALTIDKAATRTICGMLFGNTLKAVNSAFNMALLGIFEGDDSLFNIYAAFQNLFETVGKIESVTLRKPDGEIVVLPIRYFYVADYKSEKSVAGLKSGTPTYPSINCLSTTKETYAELDFAKKCVPRPSGFHEKYSQQKPSLAPFIPLQQFIPPPLHMTLGPGAALFDYLFEVVAKIDAQNDNNDEIYQMLNSNSNWPKQLRSIHAEITVLQDELADIQETAELYSALLSSKKDKRKLKPCSLNDDCMVNVLKKNIPSLFVTCCETCAKPIHRCCKSIDLSCPRCIPFKPTIDSGKNHLVHEQDLINQRIAELIIKTAEKELLFRQEANKLNGGVLSRTLERVLQTHGGSKKAFFQSYSGSHLIKMGNKLDRIIEDLPDAIKGDERITVILEAIRLFFDAKKSMKKNLNMSDEDIETMKQKILQFGIYMKENLGTMKTKQKGHLFLFEAPEFASIFKTASFFTDEAVESYHPLCNDQEKRLKFKECPKKFLSMMKWGIDHNYYYDNVDCKIYNE